MPIRFVLHVRRFVPVAMITLLCAATVLSTSAYVHAQAPDSAPASKPGSNDPSSLAGPYLKWLNEDAQWIITLGERSAYMSLASNDERMQFIQQFWFRRNPEPGSSENKFKEEHYRRLAYANQHFASGGPGWKSDRGHVYIVYGPPDSIDAHLSGANGDAQPFEVWHYDALRPQTPKGESESAQDSEASIIRDVNLKFVDTCHCGDYKAASPIP
jgi:GWxTD domain-containing protein